MPDARIPLVQRLKDALSRPLRILPDDDPEWIEGKAPGDDLWVEESLTQRPMPPRYPVRPPSDDA
jgi:hypothetical protein